MTADRPSKRLLRCLSVRLAIARKRDRTGQDNGELSKEDFGGKKENKNGRLRAAVTV